MSIMKINPTRMELRRLKTRLKTAVRGHKLLKDKSDEMIRRFIIFAKENKRLREEVERELNISLRNFMFARSVSDSFAIEEAVSMPSVSVNLVSETHSIMNVAVPKLTIEKNDNTSLLPYSLTSITSELDSSIIALSQLLVKLVRLAEVEKTSNMLADEIEKNRRRVNALEYVLIPDIKETIKYITMKLDENDRGTTIRLMKFKQIMEKKLNESN